MKISRNKYENKKIAHHLEKQSNIKNKTLILRLYNKFGVWKNKRSFLKTG